MHLHVLAISAIDLRTHGMVSSALLRQRLSETEGRVVCKLSLNFYRSCTDGCMEQGAGRVTEHMGCARPRAPKLLSSLRLHAPVLMETSGGGIKLHVDRRPGGWRVRSVVVSSPSDQDPTTHA